MSDIRRFFAAAPSIAANKNNVDSLSCPFCQFRHHDFGLLQSHVQGSHSDQIEGPSDGKDDQNNLSDAELAQLLAFEEAGIPAELAIEDAKKDRPSNETTEAALSDEDLWIDCFCGERILLQEIDIHSNMHQLEIQDADDVEDGQTIEPVTPGGSLLSSSRAAATEFAYHNSASDAHQIQARRLGKSELGPYAYEERMPKWLQATLHKNTGVRFEEVYISDRAFRYSALENETPLLIPKIQLLSRADHKVLHSVFCSPVVNHVSKLFKEGGFCGYRNIQMMISYLRGCHIPEIGKTFKGSLPTIFQLQDDIEAAWDSGIQTHARSETGGIKNTRKYIGTAEATALFTSKSDSCRTEAFTSTDQLAACDAMLLSLRNYFTRRRGSNPPAPVYLQYKGHSMTVVGFEELALGGTKGAESETSLVIFDPMFRVPSSLKKLSVNTTKPESKLHFLKAFRYPRQRFKRFNQFELLFLES